MDWRKFVIALLCIGAAFYLYAKHIDGGGTFLALIGGSHSRPRQDASQRTPIQKRTPPHRHLSLLQGPNSERADRE